MRHFIHLVVFTLDKQQYALPLAVVERVVHIVEITLLPKAPEFVLGIINRQGQVIPVINLRRCFHLSERELKLSDQLIIALAAERLVALVVDTVIGLVEISEEQIMAAEVIIPNMQYVSGVVKLNDDLVFIHNLAELLSFKEAQILDQAMTMQAANES